MATPNRRTHSNRHLLTELLAAMAVAIAPATQAAQELVEFPAVVVQESLLPYRQFNKVEITGSSIVRKEQTQALPVQILRRVDIQNSTALSLSTLVQSLPGMSSFSSSGTIGGSRGGYASAAIHGMGTGTVVLVNGKRLAGFGRQTISGEERSGADLNAIPLSAVERIEVLTDGASSIYGTDALAGVVNIITREERKGTEVALRSHIPAGGRGQSRTFDLSTGGGSLTRDGHAWVMSFDLQRTDALQGADRPYASQGRYAISQDGKNYWVYGPSLQAQQTTPTLSGSASAPYTPLWNAAYANGQCPDHQTPAWGQPACLNNMYRAYDLYPAMDAALLHTQGTLMVDANTRIKAELSLQDTRFARDMNPWGTLPLKIGSAPGDVGSALALANGFTPGAVWLLYSGSELGPRERIYNSQNRRFALHLQGQWDDWDYRSSYYYSDNTANYNTSKSPPAASLNLTSNGVLSNPAVLEPLSSPTPGSQALRSALLSGMQRVDLETGTIALQGVDIKGSRSLWELDGQEALLALGADWRQESGRYKTNDPSITQPSWHGQRQILATFAELQWPGTDHLEWIAALRNDHYSDFGNTAHGKLSVKWTPDAQWLVRASTGTGFRAPSLAQKQATGVFGAQTVSYNCTPELSALAAGMGGTCPADQRYWIQTTGNPELKPELSRQWNLGTRFTPNRNNSFSIDYWHIAIRNGIVQLPSLSALRNPSAYPDNFVLDSNAGLRLLLPMGNLGETLKSGLDLGWQYRLPTEWGQLNAQAMGSWLLQSRNRATRSEPWSSDLGTLSPFSGYVVPKLRTQWLLGLTRPDWHLQARLSHTHAYDDGGFTGIDTATGTSTVVSHHRVAAYWTLDLSARYSIHRQLELLIGLENAFNRRAPVSFSQVTSVLFGVDTTYSSVLGRTLLLAAHYRF